MTRSTTVTTDFYEVLNLPFSESPVAPSKQQLKVAYHKALLKHHPDKAPGPVARDNDIRSLPPSSHDSSPPKSTVFTVDEITAAYKTLSDPFLRAEYDRSLRLDRARVAGREKIGTVFHTGLETVDLEDLVCEDGEGDVDSEQPEGAIWYRDCRCGDERGFLVTEQDLERETDHGEIVVGCRGCSLWMKILFAVETSEDEDDGRGVGQKT